jgi:hypothetical protein
MEGNCSGGNLVKYTVRHNTLLQMLFKFSLWRYVSTLICHHQVTIYTKHKKECLCKQGNKYERLLSNIILVKNYIKDSDKIKITVQCRNGNKIYKKMGIKT